jgi:hypothetical protein
MAQKARCPRCDKTRIDTSQVRELPDGTPFRKRWPLVRCLLWAPIISLSSLIAFKAVFVTLVLAGATVASAVWRNRRGMEASRPKEVHSCRQCGYSWKHAAGEPEPAPFGPPQA